MSADENLSAKQFVDRVKQTGGATMNARTGQLVNPGQKAYMIGGEPDKHGARIPTKYVPASEFNEGHVHDAVNALREVTGNRARVNLGAWQDDGNVELDASSTTRRPGEAIRKGRGRGEKAIWDNRKMREVNTRPDTGE